MIQYIGRNDIRVLQLQNIFYEKNYFGWFESKICNKRGQYSLYVVPLWFWVKTGQLKHAVKTLK